MVDQSAEVRMPDGTLDLRAELVPTAQRWLENGLTPSFIRACVRIEEFKPFSGGLNADVVGGLKIGLRLVLKLGGPELRLHARLIQAANERRTGTFIEVVGLAELENERWLMMMGHLRATTLFDAVYVNDSDTALLARAVAKLYEGFALVHELLYQLDAAHSFTDPAYDHGKVRHLKKAVGWALLPGDRSPCGADRSAEGVGWRLSAWLEGEPQAAEWRRSVVQGLIEKRLQAGFPRQGAHAAEGLAAARASVHLGLLGRMKGNEDHSRRLFVLAHALAALAEWHALNQPA